jgi:phenylacetate-CoA ligase
MSDDDMLRYRRFINERKPPLIVAYVQSAYEFARFVLDNGLSVESPRGIVVSAGTLYQRHREVIEEAFGCKAYNRYGSRELHCMACECEHHEGLHLDTFCHYIELLDERQRPVTEEGGRGEIVVTLFYNPIMPLIRYRTGDLGIYTKKQCSCGRGLPLIRGVTGRTVDVFVNDAGEKIDGEYFTHLFYAVPWIKRFQVVQKSTTRLVIRAVAAGMVDEVRRGEIEDKITLVMGSRCRIEWEWVGQIEPSRSGKYRYTISELSR